MGTTALIALIRKDLKVFFADRRAVLLSFAAPLAIASFFGFIFGGQSGKARPSRIPVQVVDEDGSAVTREIINRLAADEALAVTAASADAARAAVRKGKATVAVVVPPGFGAAAGRAFFRGEGKPEVALLYDPSHAAELGMVRGILTQHVMRAVSQEMFSGQQGRAALQEALAELERNQTMAAEDRQLLREMLQSVDRWYGRVEGRSDAGQASAPGGLSMPYEVREEPVTAGEDVKYSGFAHAFAGMGVQFTLFMALEGGVAILLQRQRGIWKRLRAAPLSRQLLLGSRMLSATFIALLILFAGFAFGRVVFGVRVAGSLAGLVGVCLASALMASAFGLLIAALGKTPEATRGLAIFVTLIMVMLGGAWIPSFIFPSWLQKVTLAVPTRWAVDGLDAMTWRGLGLGAAAGPIAALLAFAALFVGIAVARFRWEVD